MISFGRQKTINYSGESFGAIDKALTEIENTSSRNDKLRIIEKYKDLNYFGKVVEYALNPFKMYGITSVYPYNKISTMERHTTEYTFHTQSPENFFAKLDELANKSGATNLDKEELSWLAAMDKESVKVANRILKKDLRCGASIKTFRKYFPELPVHEVMLCDNDLEKFIKYCEVPENVRVSLKLDGVRTWACHYGENIRYVSRNGKDYCNFSVFTREVKDLAEYIAKMCGEKDATHIIIDGEAIADDRDFDAFVGNAKKEVADTSKFTYHVFDFVCITQPDLMLDTRLLILQTYFDANSTKLKRLKLVEHTELASWDDIQTLLDEALRKGEEGLVLKCAHDPYVYKRSISWCKVKKRETLDLSVIGVEPGTGKYAGMMGALIVDYNGTSVKVGSGYTDIQRKEYLYNPPSMIEVAYQSITANGSLRFPIFIKRRDDKFEE